MDKKITSKLAKEHQCYILITCDTPSLDGKMQVEMSYEGDPVLANYLLQGAQQYFDSQEEEELPDSNFILLN